MSLDYNYSKINFEQFNPEDRRYADELFGAAAWLCMALDLPGPTTKNIEEFIRRYKIYVSMFKTLFEDRDSKYNLLSEKCIRETLCDRLTTNVAPKTATQWNKRMMIYAAAEGERRLGRYTHKFYGMVLGSDDG